MTDKMSDLLSKEEMICELLKKQMGYYKAILELENQQKDKFNQTHSLEEIKSLIAKKQILYRCVNEVGKAMEPLIRYWKDKKDRSDETSRRVIRELQELQTLLQSIRQLDTSNQTNIKNHLQFLKNRTKNE